MKLYYWLREWQLPGQQHKGADKVDVPTDAAGLCAWLNERQVPICLPLNPPPEPEPTGMALALQANERRELTAREAYDQLRREHPELFNDTPVNRPAKPNLSATFEATEIEDFILNRASIAQVENIFACIGNRFATTAKVN